MKFYVILRDKDSLYGSKTNPSLSFTSSKDSTPWRPLSILHSLYTFFYSSKTLGLHPKVPAQSVRTLFTVFADGRQTPAFLSCSCAHGDDDISIEFELTF